MFFGMTCLFWHGFYFSLVETQCHLETTHLRMPSLGKSKILQHYNIKRAKHSLKTLKTLPMLGNSTSPSRNPVVYYQIQSKIKENQDDTYLLSHCSLELLILPFSDLCILTPLLRQ